MRRYTARVVALLLIPLVASCQTFGMKKPVPKPLGSFQRIDRGKYAVKIDLLSPEQSRQHFGVNLNEIGIQAVNIELENKNAAPLQLNLDDIYFKDQDKYLYRPLTLDRLAKKIYESNKYKEMANYGARDAGIYGAAGAVIGAVGALILGGTDSVARGGAIGGWGGASAGAIKGANQAKEQATERIKDGLGELMMTSNKIPEDSKVKGLVFFQILPEEVRSLKTLEIHLTETETRNKLNLELELQVAPEDARRK
ncbi:MAG: hypothetical protein HYY20_13915 [Candidatus Tectomicrobia bacterium]|uniref:Uncharacterized protein n=1 Tax=Tectimicrobiota bacterium TaxID=2528274 RepID=A0A932CR79_UNCTE|nr:hypothetical protein [Candidatus Tectomicrobia bacterium]